MIVENKNPDPKIGVNANFEVRTQKETNKTEQTIRRSTNLVSI